MKHALMLATALLAATSGMAAAQDSATAAKIRAGYAINPAPLNLNGKNPALVGVGSEFVMGQGGCKELHTAPP